MRLGLCKYCLALAFWRRENEKEKKEKDSRYCVVLRKDGKKRWSWHHELSRVEKTRGTLFLKQKGKKEQRLMFEMGNCVFYKQLWIQKSGPRLEFANGVPHRTGNRYGARKSSGVGFFLFFLLNLWPGFPKDIGIKPTNKPTTDGSIDFDTKSNVYQQALEKTCRQKWLKKTYMYMCIHIACRFDFERDWRANGCYGSVLPWRRHVLCKPFEVAASSKTRFF